MVATEHLLNQDRRGMEGWPYKIIHLRRDEEGQVSGAAPSWPGRRSVGGPPRSRRGLIRGPWQRDARANGRLASTADRHQWAIARGKEYEASAHQQAVLVYIAFRVGKDNKCYWPLDKIAEQTRMHKNTVSKCLRWWTRRGVLKATGPTSRAYDL